METTGYTRTARTWLRTLTAGDIRLLLANRRWPTGKSMSGWDADVMARSINDQAADSRLMATRANAQVWIVLDRMEARLVGDPERGTLHAFRRAWRQAGGAAGNTHIHRGLGYGYIVTGEADMLTVVPTPFDPRGYMRDQGRYSTYRAIWPNRDPRLNKETADHGRRDPVEIPGLV